MGEAGRVDKGGHANLGAIGILTSGIMTQEALMTPNLHALLGQTIRCTGKDLTSLEFVTDHTTS